MVIPLVVYCYHHHHHHHQFTHAPRPSPAVHHLVPAAAAPSREERPLQRASASRPRLGQSADGTACEYECRAAA